MLQSDESDTAEMLRWLRNEVQRNSSQDPGNANINVARTLSDTFEVDDGIQAQEGTAADGVVVGTSSWGRSWW